jgi:hypothetical protein
VSGEHRLHLARLRPRATRLLILLAMADQVIE